MAKKWLIKGVIIASVLSICSSNAFAYRIKSLLPTVRSMSYYTHSSMGSSFKSAATSAASTWSAVSNGISFSRIGDSSGTVTVGNNRSDVAYCNFVDLAYLGVPPDVNAVTACVGSYSNFDIFVNSTVSWGNGNSTSYLDRQGIFTHEFGHAAGLDENSSLPLNTSPDRIPISYYQTMWPYDTDPLGRSVTYYFRSLEYDDESGVRAVAARIN